MIRTLKRSAPLVELFVEQDRLRCSSFSEFRLQYLALFAGDGSEKLFEFWVFQQICKLVQMCTNVGPDRPDLGWLWVVVAAGDSH